MSAPSSPGPGDGPAAVPPARRSARRTFAATTLVLESLVVFFATLVAFRTSDVPAGLTWPVGLGLSLACLLAAGLLRSTTGYVLGSVLQVLLVASGFWVAAMFLVGAIFAVMWFSGLRLGARLDAEAAARG